MYVRCLWKLKGVGAGFAGADADGLLDAGDEDLAVADLAGMGGLLDGLNGTLDLAVVDGKIFVTGIEQAVRIRTGETGTNAL